MHRAKKLGIAATIFILSCIAFNALSTATAAAIAPSIHAADYNIVNTGTHPITPSMIFPNDTAWKDPKVECLIITDQTFVVAFQPLADLKTSRGVYTIIVTVESIYTDARFNVSGTSDTSPQAAYIRNAIKHYYQVNGTEFVILGGDVDVIPIRYVYNPDNTGSKDRPEAFSGQYTYYYKPTDHYYACLEGTWDSDGDGKFGEMGVVGTSVDEIDWTAEVFVGRIPANSVPEVTNMVQKIVTYETNPPSGVWFNKAVFGGGVSQYASSEGPSVDEAELSEFIIDSYFASMANTRLYHVTPDYTPPSTYTELTKPSLLAAWNLGSSLLNLAGHGSPQSFVGAAPGGGYNEYLSQLNAAALINGGKLSLTYIFSCSSGAFDYAELNSATNSLSEELMLNSNGGAIAVVSAIRTTYYFTVDPLFEALNEGQNRFFWREFMTNNEYQPGRALYLSQKSYIEQFIDKYWNVELNHDPELAKDPDYLGSEEKFRKNLLAYNLLGDPEISIYTNVPRAFSADIVAQNASIGDELVLEITDDAGMPVPNARVLVNGSGYYIVARANSLGIASVRIPHDPALNGTSMNVTLSGHNMNVSRGAILVIEDTQTPSSLKVDVPSVEVDYLGTLIVNATGIDAGSGLRYAFIVVVDETGNPIAVHKMARSRVEGNSTSFRFVYPGALPPGNTIRFYAIAFDASGNYVIATPAQDQLYTVTITSRLVEVVMLGVITIGIPAAIVLILMWFIKTRRQRLQRASNSA